MDENYEKNLKKILVSKQNKKCSWQINQKKKFSGRKFKKKSIVEGKLLFLESLERKWSMVEKEKYEIVVENKTAEIITKQNI